MPDPTIPAPYARMARAIQEMEAAAIVCDLAQGRHQILNVGPSWGRDHYALTAAGHRVFSLDIAVQQHLPRLTIADAARVLPFADQTFDVVLMAEVLEHIWNDFRAVHEARRVLRDDGRLIVTVPFFHDIPEYHIRIHSPRTIHRLLSAGGFHVTDYIERGGLITYPRAIHGLRKIMTLAGKGDAVSRAVIRFDVRLGRRHSWVLHHSPAFGCYIAATKSQVKNYTQLNASEFAH